MTCVVGVVERDEEAGDRIYLAGDSMASSPTCKVILARPKVFRKKGDHPEMLVGYSGSVREMQVAESSWGVPYKPTEKSAHDWVVGDVVPSLVEALSSSKAIKDGGPAKSQSIAIIATMGQLFEVESDFGVIESTDLFAAIGSGWAHALGALSALEGSGETAENLAEEAINAASRFTPFVGGPIHGKWLRPS